MQLGFRSGRAARAAFAWSADFVLDFGAIDGPELWPSRLGKARIARQPLFLEARVILTLCAIWGSGTRGAREGRRTMSARGNHPARYDPARKGAVQERGSP